MTNSVASGNPWRTLHLTLVGAVAFMWTMYCLAVFLVKGLHTPSTTGVLLGTGAMLPHVLLGQKLWHDPRRKGVAFPVALLVLRFSGSLIVFSIFLWQFPSQQRIIAMSGSSLIIVFSAIEAFLFGKGVGRL